MLPRAAHHGRCRGKPPKPPKNSAPAIRDPRPAAAADYRSHPRAGLSLHSLNWRPRLAVSHLVASRGEQILVERPLLLTISHGCRGHLCALPRRQSKGGPADIGGSAHWQLCCEGCGTQLLQRGVRRCSGATASGMSVRPGARHATASTTTTSTQSLRRSACSATRRTGLRLGAVRRACSPRRRLTPSGWSASLRARTRRARASLASAPPPSVISDEARVPPSELLDLLERHGCNLYGVTGGRGEDVAGASFAGFFHLFNHSCSPNVVFDSATQVQPASPDGGAPLFALRALFDVASGEELCISYTSSADGKRASSERVCVREGGCERGGCERGGWGWPAASFPSPFLKSHPYHSHIRTSHAHSPQSVLHFTPLVFARTRGPKSAPIIWRSTTASDARAFDARPPATSAVSSTLPTGSRCARCSRNECGSGLSVPVLPARAPVEGEGTGRRGRGGGVGRSYGGLLEVMMRSAAPMTKKALRCAACHCGGVWQSEPDEWAEWRPL